MILESFVFMNKIIEQKLKENMLAKEFEEARKDTENILNQLDPVDVINNGHFIDAQRYARSYYEQAKQDCFEAIDLEEQSKAELDSELMDIFGVDSLDQLRPQWIKVALTGGNLQNDTEWDTEEEFELLINASERFTKERARALKMLAKKEDGCLTKVQESAKKMHSKQACADRLKTSNDGKRYEEQVQQFNWYKNHFATIVHTRKRVLNVNPARIMRDLQGEYKSFEEEMEKNIKDLQKLQVSEKDIYRVVEHFSGYTCAIDGKISSKALMDLYSTRPQFKGEVIDEEGVLDSSEKLIQLLDESIDVDRVCDPTLEAATVKTMNDGVALESPNTQIKIDNIQKVKNSVASVIDEIAEMSMNDLLSEGSKLMDRAVYYMQDLEKELNLDNPNPCSADEIDEKLQHLGKLIGQLINNNIDVNSVYEQNVYEKRQEVYQQMTKQVDINGRRVSSYIYTINGWMINMLKDMGKYSAEHLNNEQQQACEQYVEAKLEQIKNHSNAIEQRTEEKVPKDLKERFKDVLQIIRGNKIENSV